MENNRADASEVDVKMVRVDREKQGDKVKEGCLYTILLALYYRR